MPVFGLMTTSSSGKSTSSLGSSTILPRGRMAWKRELPSYVLLRSKPTRQLPLCCQYGHCTAGTAKIDRGITRSLPARLVPDRRSRAISEEAAAAKHIAQLQHNMWVANAPSAVLSIVTGGGKWVKHWGQLIRFPSTCIDINAEVFFQPRASFEMFDRLAQMAQARRIALLREISLRREFARRARRVVGRLDCL